MEGKIEMNNKDIKLKERIDNLFEFIDVLYRKIDRIEQMMTMLISDVYEDNNEDNLKNIDESLIQDVRDNKEKGRLNKDIEFDKKKEMEYDYDKDNLTSII